MLPRLKGLSAEASAHLRSLSIPRPRLPWQREEKGWKKLKGRKGRENAMKGLARFTSPSYTPEKWTKIVLKIAVYRSSVNTF